MQSMNEKPLSQNLSCTKLCNSSLVKRRPTRIPSPQSRRSRRYIVRPAVPSAIVAGESNDLQILEGCNFKPRPEIFVSICRLCLVQNEDCFIDSLHWLIFWPRVNKNHFGIWFLFINIAVKEFCQNGLPTRGASHWKFFEFKQTGEKFNGTMDPSLLFKFLIKGRDCVTTWNV